MVRGIEMTRLDADERIGAWLAARSGADRIRVACDMFDTARALAVASLPDEVASNPAELGIALIERFYGRDLRPEFLARIADDLRVRRSLTTE